MIKIEFNDSELQNLSTQVRKLTNVKPVLWEKETTNFDLYLEEQLQNRTFAARFVQANAYWDLIMQGENPVVIERLYGADDLPVAAELTSCPAKCP